MARVKSPQTGGEVDAGGEALKRFLAAGWTLVDADLASESGDPAVGDEVSARPRKNASRDDWAAYAESLGIEVPESAKQSEIRALVDADLADDES